MVGGRHLAENVIQKGTQGADEKLVYGADLGFARPARLDRPTIGPDMVFDDVHTDDLVGDLGDLIQGLALKHGQFG